MANATPAKLRRINASDHDLKFHVPPECQGQIVEVSYAGEHPAGIIRRVHDRSDRITSHSVCAWEDFDGDDDREFDPWNSEPVVSEDCWEPLELVGGAS